MRQPPTQAHPARVVFMGSPDFAVPSLRRLIEDGYDVAGVYTQPDRAAGRGRHAASPPVKRFALRAGLPVFQPAGLRQPDAVAELAALRPDLIVVVAFGQILRPSVLALPRRGVVNVHASLLPAYRGASPIAAALLAGEPVTGVTIMLLDEGMDTGPILAQRPEPVLPQDTTGSLTERLAELGASLLVETLPRWLADQIEPRPQDERLASITHRINKDDGRLDWRLSARDLWCRVRAYTPWPGATTSLDGVSVQILQAWPLDDPATSDPGRIVPLPHAVDLPDGVEQPRFGVETGRGLLLPLMLQKAGRRALSARDFANGERGLIGRRFD